MNPQTNFYPVFLNIRGQKVVVMGGGEIALRKVKTLLECGAAVEVIGSKIIDGLEVLAAGRAISLQRRNFAAGDLKGAFIAIAATDDVEVNRRVAREGRETGVMVNIVDDLAGSDFIVPSYLRRGPVTIAVSTAGQSPALARKIRTRLEKEFGEEWATVASLINEVRTELARKGITVDGERWQEELDLDWLLNMVLNGREQEARVTMLNRIEKSVGSSTK